MKKSPVVVEKSSDQLLPATDLKQEMGKLELLGFDSYGDPISSCIIAADLATQSVRSVKLPQGVISV